MSAPAPPSAPTTWAKARVSALELAGPEPLTVSDFTVTLLSATTVTSSVFRIMSLPPPAVIPRAVTSPAAKLSERATVRALPKVESASATVTASTVVVEVAMLLTPPEFSIQSLPALPLMPVASALPCAEETEAAAAKASPKVESAMETEELVTCSVAVAIESIVPGFLIVSSSLPPVIPAVLAVPSMAAAVTVLLEVTAECRIRIGMRF